MQLRRSATLLPLVIAISLGVTTLSGCLSGCFSSNPNALRENTADATAAAKHATGQIAAGIVQGLFRKGPRDLNTASSKDLASLPGMTPALARAVIAGRPYSKPEELVTRNILTRAQFNRVRAQLKVTPSS